MKIKRTSNWMKSIGLVVLGVITVLSGIILFTAEKTAAGLALIMAGLIIALSFFQTIWQHRLIKWAGVALIVALYIVALIGITGTDIPPNAQTSGYKFFDQVSVIFQRFIEKTFGA